MGIRYQRPITLSMYIWICDYCFKTHIRNVNISFPTTTLSHWLHLLCQVMKTHDRKYYEDRVFAMVYYPQASLNDRGDLYVYSAGMKLISISHNNIYREGLPSLKSVQTCGLLWKIVSSRCKAPHACEP